MAESSKVYSYTVIFERLPEGGYNVVVPAIPEICTFGETRAEARLMAEDAIRKQANLSTEEFLEFL